MQITFFFSKNISIHAIFNDQTFNDTLTISLVLNNWAQEFTNVGSLDRKGEKSIKFPKLTSSLRHQLNVFDCSYTVITIISHPDASYQVSSQLAFWFRRRSKQEAHRPWFAHLSAIATADMQMLCNIFPILSSQLMKISSFEQFLVLKKNIWA